MIRLDRRSIICTPGTSTDRFAVARNCGADVALVDLEDSVAPEHKGSARTFAERYFQPAGMAGSAVPVGAGDAAGSPGSALALRINSPCGLDGLRDLVAVAGWAHRPVLVLVPKVEAARDVEIVAAALDRAGHGLELYAVIETPRGVFQLPAIVRSPQLAGVVFGAADYALHAGCRLGWDALLYARSALVTAAAAAGLPAIDSPSFDLADLTGLRREAERARELGYCGKVAVHPRQVPVLNEAFFPSQEEIARARRVAAAGRDSGMDVTAADGRMVGAPFFAAARTLLAQVDQHGARARGPDPADSAPPPVAVAGVAGLQ